jgi:uncharacterized protein YkwD
MRGPAMLALVLSAAAGLAGCEALLTDQDPDGSQSCSAGFATCAGADCYGSCVCEGGSAAACERDCGGAPVATIASLDESSWDPAWEAFEEEVVALVNDARADGGCCGNEGCFDAAPPLAIDPVLRSAARLHSTDMAERGFFDHDNPDGRTPFDRIREAGWDGCAMGENIAEGYETPAEVVDGWLRSPGHCANIRTELFDSIGVGFVEAAERSPATLWTQAFGG